MLLEITDEQKTHTIDAIDISSVSSVTQSIGCGIWWVSYDIYMKTGLKITPIAYSVAAQEDLRAKQTVELQEQRKKVVEHWKISKKEGIVRV